MKKFYRMLQEGSNCSLVEELNVNHLERTTESKILIVNNAEFNNFTKLGLVID